MARFRIVRTWPDSETLSVSVEVEGEHPDGWDMAATRTRRLYAEALADTVESFGDDEE